jgi:hypothetical protein
LPMLAQIQRQMQMLERCELASDIETQILISI